MKLDRRGWGAAARLVEGCLGGRPHHRSGLVSSNGWVHLLSHEKSRFVSCSGPAEAREPGRGFDAATPTGAHVSPGVPGATAAMRNVHRWVGKVCRAAARTAIPSRQRSERRTRSAAARHRRASGRGRPRRVAVRPPSSISPHRQQLAVSPAPGQELISLRSLSVLAIEILRGLARSAIGILSVSTPAS